MHQCDTSGSDAKNCFEQSGKPTWIQEAFRLCRSRWNVKFHGTSSLPVHILKPMQSVETPPRYVLFDGVCNLCNSAVNFIIDRDPGSRFKFAAIQSPEGKLLLSPHGVSVLVPLKTLILIDGGKMYSRSSAALRIVRHLDGLWPSLYCMILVPRPIRDAVYDWIARNRYRWFGSRAHCRVPTPEQRGRFAELPPHL